VSVVDVLAVAAAERVETLFGAAAALSSYRAVVRRAAAGEARARALRGMLRAALAARDDAAVSEVADTWQSAGFGDHLPAVIHACKELARRGAHGLAAQLAAAEVARHRTARALYLLGRTAELAGDAPRAAEALADAAARAAREGAADVGAAARARAAELRARTPATGIPESLDVTGQDPRRALAVHAARLAAAPSRFARASALGALEELARAALARGDRPAAEGAILAAARHADATGDALTPLEADRVAAALRLWPAAGEADAALRRLRALSEIAAAAPGDARDDAIVRAAEAAPEIAADVHRARARPDAIDVARVLAAAEAHAASPSPAEWTAVRLGLGDATLLARAAGVARLAVAAARGAPPRGWLSLGRALAAAAEEETAVAALRRADAAREAGAAEALGHALLARAWRLAGRSLTVAARTAVGARAAERASAREALEEAKALAARGR
jgi:hypothetical protein